MQQNCNEFEFALPENPLPARFQLYRKQKKLTDVTIKVGGLELEAHRLVLEDSSPVIRAALSENWSNGKVLEFTEDSLDWEIVEDLLNFFYTARVKITLENAHSLCLAAHYLHIPNLLEACDKFLASKVSLENILNLNNLSTKLELKSLRKSCAEFFAVEYKNILKDEKLLFFGLEEITQILEEMKVDNEDDKDLRENMFRFMISWVENDSQNREPSLPMLLKSLPLHELSTQFLSNEVSPNPMINNSFPCSRLLNEAFTKSVLRPLHSCSKGSNLYCIGGKNENNEILSSVSKMNLTTRQWENLPTMSQSRYAFGAVVIKNKIYVCGGYARNTRINNLEVFDCQTKIWTELPPMLKGRTHFGMTTLNGKIYVSGDADHCSIVEEYSPDTKTWKEIKSLNQARWGSKLVNLNGEMYAIGGGDTNTAEKYNSSTNTWHFVASLNNIHYRFGCAVHDNKIYILSYNGFEVYDSISNTWRNLSKLDIGYAPELVSFNNKLWAVGGGEGNNIDKASKSMFEYDTINDSWQKLPDMDVPRSHHCSVVSKY